MDPAPSKRESSIGIIYEVFKEVDKEWKYRSVMGVLRRVFLFDIVLKIAFGSTVKKFSF